MILNNSELLLVEGGAINMSSTLLNSLARVITTIIEWGQMIGSSLYRIKSGKYCR